ncbi:MAG TPA: outer-membrane lipoprotein carrier protein LolA [Terracidiphilus sp.]|jgi:outer membrane lipoprotein-sorting protein
MQFRKLALFATTLALIFAPVDRLAGQDLKSVLVKLDAAAANFHSSSADLEYQNVMTDPVPDTEIQKGSVYYLRKGNGFESGIHINQIDGKPVPKTIVFAGGTLKIYDKLPDQLTTVKEAGQYESYLALGFGASGKDLVDKFDVKYLGSETIGTVKTEKLELVAKDPKVLKYFPKITIWVDPTRAVSLKQVFDEGQGQSRTGIFSNIKINQSLPSGAFTFKTDSKTQTINR